jgi:predicted dehydrogenase
VKVGIAGIGFMGWIHWLAYQKVATANVAAICTRDPAKLAGDWTGIEGNFGPPGEQVELDGVTAHSQIDALLADDELDVIDICLPPNLHLDVATRAMRAGKHVFCEKPMALTPADCESMVAVSQETGRLLLIGQVLPFFPEYAFALRQIRSGAYGNVLGGVFKRVISDPTWLKDFYSTSGAGGPLIDLHVHDAHFIRLLFGMPKQLTSRGRLRGEVTEYCNTIFDFEDSSLAVSATCGVINQQGRSFTHGFEIHCQEATLQYEFAVVGSEAEMMMPLTVFHRSGSVERPELGDGDPVNAFVAEIEEVSRAVATGVSSPTLGGDLARDAIILCQRQEDAVRSGGYIAVE